MQTLREFLTRNWLTKLFSVALATLLWIAVSGQANSEIGISIPLEYRDIPSQLEVVGDTPTVVDVRLRGSSVQIREISAKDVSATLDLNGVGAGRKILRLTSQNVKVPFGIEVVRVSPSLVRLTLEHTIAKTVPVVIRVDGEPPPEFEIDGMSVAPATVEVEGPESKMRTLEAMPTARIDIEQRETSFSGLVDLDLPDPTLRLHYLSPVDVHINIRPKP